MHHAYVLQGAGVLAQTALDAFLKEQGLAISNTADMSRFSYERLGVDDVRSIVSRSMLTPVSQTHHVVVVSFATATTEAQNALLKTLEEPAPHALFVLITPSVQQLLPTIRSRVQALEPIRDGAHEVVADFLARSPEERLVQLKPLLEKNEETNERQLQRMTHFLLGLEAALARMDRKESREGLRALYRTKKSILMPGAPLKPLLEQLAFLLPVVKA